MVTEGKASNKSGLKLEDLRAAVFTFPVQLRGLGHKSFWNAMFSNLPQLAKHKLCSISSGT